MLWIDNSLITEMNGSLLFYASDVFCARKKELSPDVSANNLTLSVSRINAEIVFPRIEFRS